MGSHLEARKHATKAFLHPLRWLVVAKGTLEVQEQLAPLLHALVALELSIPPFCHSLFAN